MVEFFVKRKLVTLSLAQNYCGEFDNAGAMMSVDKTLMCSFQMLKPTDKKLYPYAGGGGMGSGKPVTATKFSQVCQVQKITPAGSPSYNLPPPPVSPNYFFSSPLPPKSSSLVTKWQNRQMSRVQSCFFPLSLGV